VQGTIANICFSPTKVITGGISRIGKLLLLNQGFQKVVITGHWTGFFIGWCASMAGYYTVQDTQCLPNNNVVIHSFIHLFCNK